MKLVKLQVGLVGGSVRTFDSCALRSCGAKLADHEVIEVLLHTIVALDDAATREDARLMLDALREVLPP